MRDKQLCADIGKRIKQRRKELNLSLGYIADKMGVNISTAQRYEAGLYRHPEGLPRSHAEGLPGYAGGSAAGPGHPESVRTDDVGESASDADGWHAGKNTEIQK